VQLVAELWTSLGYMAEATVDPTTGHPVIRKHNCAVRAVAERYPEVCAEEQAFIAELLGEPVVRTQHILAGCNACEYLVRVRADASPPGDLVAADPPIAAAVGPA
jgi:DeoR family suf operon transcriptional repressor